MKPSYFLGLSLFVIVALAVAWWIAQPGSTEIAPVTAAGTPTQGGAEERAVAETDTASREDTSRESTPARVAAMKEDFTLRVFGVVRVPFEHSAIPHAELDVSIIVHSQEDRVVEVGRKNGDASGGFSFDVEVLEEWRDVEDDWLSVTVAIDAWAPRHSHERVEEEVDLNVANELEMVVDLYPGADVSGFVYNSSGEPADAELRFIFDDQDPTSGDADVFDASTDDSGFYRVHLERDGKLTIRARERGVGTARLDGFAIDAGVRTRVPDLHLSGTGVLGGALRDPDGRTIAKHRVQVIATELIDNVNEDPSTWSFETFNDFGYMTGEGADGLMYLFQETRPDGTFHFSGLRPGRYLVQAVSRSGRIATPRELFDTGETDIELVLPIHRLAATIVDGEEEFQVHCSERAAEQRAIDAPYPRPLDGVGKDPTVFEVLPDRDYLVAIAGADSLASPILASWKLPTAEKIVHIEPDRYYTSVELARESSTGTLAIEIDDPAGRFSFEVFITSLKTGRLIQSGSIMTIGRPFPIELGAGEYLIQLNTAGPTGRPLFPGTSSKGETVGLADIDYELAHLREVVSLRAGETETVRFELSTGGRLQIRLGPGFPDTPVVGSLTGLFPEEYEPEEVPEHRAEIENAGGHIFRNFYLDTRTEGNGEEKTWYMLDKAFPAGEYVLRWTTPAGETIERDFEMTSGAVTSLVLDAP